MFFLKIVMVAVLMIPGSLLFLAYCVSLLIDHADDLKRRR